MEAGTDVSRPELGSGTERLRLRADLLAAQERIRELATDLQRAELQLERSREDLAAERQDRSRDGEWFRHALAGLRRTADEALEHERELEDLRAALDEARAAVAARDAALAALRSELNTRVRAESEALTALDTLRERPPALLAAPEPAAEPEPAAGPVVRFERRPPWPEAVAGLPRAEIEWHAGYVNSHFRAVVYQPNRRRGIAAASSATFKWLLMGEPAPDSPEFAAEVEQLATALEQAGWEPAGAGADWFSRRYVWRRDRPPPERLTLAPLQESARHDAS